MLNTPHGSKNLLQRGILYRHEKISLGRGRQQARTQENYMQKLVGFQRFLWIDQFVWARALCEIRISCPAAVDCSGTIRKIHMRKIRRDQGIARACYHDEFHHLGTVDEAPGTVQGPGVRADAQC